MVLRMLVEADAHPRMGNQLIDLPDVNRFSEELRRLLGLSWRIWGFGELPVRFAYLPTRPCDDR